MESSEKGLITEMRGIPVSENSAVYGNYGVLNTFIRQMSVKNRQYVKQTKRERQRVL